ncbi:hypothetical protein BST94_06845 [Nonlabens xylanidelens]|nr:hypothetical protein BST94_06845 [Nonlabens xylanidelens]
MIETDPDYFLPNSDKEFASMQLTLGILDDVINVEPLRFKYTVDFKIKTRNLSTGNWNQAFPRTLEVNYSPLGNISDIINDRDVLVIENAYEATIEILNVAISNLDNNSSLSNSDVQNVFLNLEFVSNHSQLLSPQPSSFNSSVFYRYPNNSSTPIVTGNSIQDAPQEVTVSWTPITGAEFYELQWTWVDNYGISSNDVKVPADIQWNTKDFDNNNTSLLLKNSSYTLPLIYERGYLLFRVRGVGYNDQAQDYGSSYVYGKWTGATNPTKAADYYAIETFSHQKIKNWQIQTSYAEEGKKKDVISYMDGSLRNRQTVTKINTDQQAIVGEAIYDHVGRPAVEILPAPAQWGPLDYHPKFNINDQDESYSFLDFEFSDPILDANCDPENTQMPYAEMSQSKGAALYYSNDTALKTTNKDNYIPDADGVPFSVTDYTNDNTGRVKRKSGVGKEHALNSGHEMKYYYGSPDQEYLNRLFGVNVGYSTYYKRNVVIDPNGQASISYVDPSGKTIATALVENAPKNLLTLSEVGRFSLFNKDLLGKVNDTAVDTNVDKNNLFYSNGSSYFNGLIFNGEELILDKNNEGVINLNYTADGSPFSPEHCEETYDAVVDYKISITDDCGNEFAVDDSGDPLSGTHTFNNAGTSDILPKSLNLNGLKLGQYNISKTLVVNEQALETALAAYLSSSCIEPIENFDVRYLLDDCDLSCEKEKKTTDIFTQEKIGLIPNFYDKTAIERASLMSLFNEMYLAYSETYDDLCAASQFDYDLWDSFYEAECVANGMLLTSHFMPGEQYAEPDGSAGYAYSIFNPNSSLPNDSNNIAPWKKPEIVGGIGYMNSDGGQSTIRVSIDSYDTQGNPIYRPAIDISNPALDPNDSNYFIVEPQDLSEESFRDLFEPQWAESLLQYHPENCYIEVMDPLCTKKVAVDIIGLISSKAFDESLLMLENSEVHVNGSDIDLLEATTTGVGGTAIMKYDPFFQFDYSTNTIVDDLSSRRTIMLDAISYDYRDGKSLWLYSYETLFSVDPLLYSANTINHNTVRNSYLSNGGVFQIEENKKQFWQLFLMNYNELKSRIVNVYASINAVNNGCYNGCIDDIGSNDYRALLSEFNNGVTAAAYNELYNLVNLPPFPQGSNLPVCDQNTSSVLNDMYRVYRPIDVIIPAGSDLQDVLDQYQDEANYQNYYESGKCPIASTTEFFLNGYFKERNELGNGSWSPGVPRNYINRHLIEAFGHNFNNQTSSLNLVLNPIDNGNTLELNLNSSNLNASCDPKFTLNFTNPNLGFNFSTYGSNWKIVSLSNLVQTSWDNSSGSNYSILVKYITDLNSTNPVIKEMVLVGTTCINLDRCNPNLSYPAVANGNPASNTYNDFYDSNSDAACGKRELFRSSLHDLMRELQANGNLFSTAPVDISNYSSFSNGYLPMHFNQNNAFWSWNGSKFIIQQSNQILFQVEVNNTNNFTSLETINSLFIDNPDSQVPITSDYNTGTINYTYIDTSTTPNTFNNEPIDFSLSFPVGSKTNAMDFSCCTGTLPLATIAPNDSNIQVPLEDLIKEVLAEYGLNGTSNLQSYQLDQTLSQSLVAAYPSIPNDNGVVSIYDFTINNLGNIAYFSFSAQGDIDFYMEWRDTGYSTGQGDCTLQNLTSELDYMFNGSTRINTSLVNANLNYQNPRLLSLNLLERSTQNYINFNLGFIRDNGSNEYKCDYNVYLRDLRDCGNPCVPIQVAPVACTPEIYGLYMALMPSLSPIDSSYYLTEKEFCEYNASIVLNDWIYYIDRVVNGNGLDSPFYLSILNFGGNALGMGHPDTRAAIDAYIDDPQYYDHLTWLEFTQEIVNGAIKIGTIQNSCPTAGVPFVTPLVDLEDPCETFQNNFARTYQNDLYNQYLEQQTAYFKRAYTDHVLSTTVENLTSSVRDLEYQYTLYYYDQAGNLVQTVPPEGIDDTFKATVQHNVINQERDSYDASDPNSSINVNNSTISPEHRLTTQYKYNSLNQLVWQSTPDGGETRFAYDKLGRIIASQNAKQASEIVTGPQAQVIINSNDINWINNRNIDFSNKSLLKK